MTKVDPKTDLNTNESYSAAEAAGAARMTGLVRTAATARATRGGRRPEQRLRRQ